MSESLEFLRNHTLAVYRSAFCPDCTRLEQWMRERGLTCAEVMIDEDESAADKLERETGKQAVPLILVDGKTWVRGYHRESPSRFDAATLLRELKEAIDGPARAAARLAAPEDPR